MGGIGKTTIVKAIYNDLFLEFEASSFLFNIRENFQQHRELELQRQLTSDIVKIEDPRIYSVEHGKIMIKNRMNSKRVLIILDDVDGRNQVDALAGASDWFGHGSVIFMTTRNKKVLKECGLSEGQIYKVNGLNYDQSCDLLKFHAFKGREPENGCRQLLDAFVKGKGSRGIPLALEVIGSTLSQSEVQDWKHVLKDLQNNPDPHIQQQLRISYDGLKEERQRQIFLDISCFFIGKDREKATHMWKACDWCPERVIPDLCSRSLIDIDQHGEFSMHDVIREMGREIVRQEAVTESWMRSRQWSSQHIFHLLRRTEKNKRVKGIVLPKSRNDFEDNERRFSAQCFELMQSLRILHLEGVSFQGNFKHFPRGLRLLVLENCGFTSQPHDFDIENVVVLNMSGCSFMAECFTNKVLKGKVVLSNLKFLNLARTQISSIPDFTNVRCLEQLILCDCTKLTDVHESIGALKSLLSLDLGGCKILSKIPDSVCELSSLKSFDLHQCDKVLSLPESLGNMTSLEKLYLDMTNIEILPDSIGSLTSLRVLSLKHCKLKTLPASLQNLLCLQHLIVEHTLVNGLENNIYYTEESVELHASSIELLAILPNFFCRRICRLILTDRTNNKLPDCVENMINLTSLELHCQALIKFPLCIGLLRRIKELRLDCRDLESLPESIGRLKKLVTFEIFSDSLKVLPDSLGGLESLEVLLIDCWSLKSLPSSIRHLENLQTLLLCSRYLSDLPASISYLGRLQNLLLRRCRSLHKLSVPPLPQQESLQHSALSQPVSSKRPEQSGHGSIPQLCSSLVCLEASYCTELREINVSDFQSLLHLDLRGSNSLPDIHGLENISNNLKSLVVPTPTWARNVNFKKRSFKSPQFPRLLMFAMECTTRYTRRNPFLPELILRCVKDFEVSRTFATSWVPQGDLTLELPKVPHAANRCLSNAQFTFDGLTSPILISVIADDGSLAFETTRHLVDSSLNLGDDDEIILRLRDIASASIKVTPDIESKITEFSASFEWETKRLDDMD
ncbi:disease resistance protein RUN1-like isoform X2 [Nymphaea colorata]|nr:disease resistance protein RUN1-like isoform X2 [Nymphaea colorata]